MADSIESAVFAALVNLLASPRAQKIGDAFDLGEDLRELRNSLRAIAQALAEAQAQAQEDVDGGLRIQRRIVAYEDEDLLHNLMIVAAVSMDSREKEQESERYELEFDGDSS